MDPVHMNATTAVKRNYPYNCWWVAAFSQDVKRDLLPRWILDTPVLLYRTEAGQVVALEDRCPHRLAPLSRGTLRGDEVECGYHGFRFGPTGRCTRVPTMQSPPPIAVESFPVKEVAPFVWIYVGDPKVIDQVPPPHELKWTTDTEFAVLSGSMTIAANYMLLKENVLDLTHFGYAHAKTFGITDWTHPPELTGDEESVSYRQRFVSTPLPAGYAIALGLQPGIIWTRETYGSFVSPALQISSNDLADPSKPDEPPMGRYRIAHASTPINQRSMHYFWVFGRDHGKGASELDALGSVVRQGFNEDQGILEAIQALADRNPRRGTSGERSVKADTAGVLARRIVDRWMARETIPQE